MPKKFEEIRKSIAESVRGKINPRTKKPYTESEIYALATSVYQRKKKGGK